VSVSVTQTKKETLLELMCTVSTAGLQALPQPRSKRSTSPLMGPWHNLPFHNIY